MKSIIVDIKDGFAAILSDNGCIVKVRNNNYEIGQVIDMKRQTTKKANKLAVWAATAAALIMVSGGTVWAYQSPYSYVSLDVNPSIEFSLNRFDQVLSVKAVNDDGIEILKEMKLDELKYKKIEDAMEMTVDQISKDGYFDGDLQGGIVIATASKDDKDAEKLAKKLQVEVQEDTVENGDNVAVEAIGVGFTRVQEARDLGVTPGKLNLIQKLQKSVADPTAFKTENYLNISVKEIMQEIKKNKRALKDLTEVATDQIIDEENNVDQTNLSEDKKSKGAKQTTANVNSNKKNAKENNNPRSKGQVQKASSNKNDQ